jgi:hypothetical protein
MESHREFLLLALSRKHTRLLECGHPGSTTWSCRPGAAGDRGRLRPFSTNARQDQCRRAVRLRHLFRKAAATLSRFLPSAGSSVATSARGAGSASGVDGYDCGASCLSGRQQAPAAGTGGIDGSPDAGRTGPRTGREGTCGAAKLAASGDAPRDRTLYERTVRERSPPKWTRFFGRRRPGG